MPVLQQFAGTLCTGTTESQPASGSGLSGGTGTCSNIVSILAADEELKGGNLGVIKKKAIGALRRLLASAKRKTGFWPDQIFRLADANSRRNAPIAFNCPQSAQSSSQANSELLFPVSNEKVVHFYL